MLHIITPLYRFENLEKIYNSIFMDSDITWHISYSKDRNLPDLKFLSEDKRIILYNVDCLDTEAFAKRNAVLDNIKDGYFCFLDDDTLFHDNMYIKYKDAQLSNFIGMLVGEQLLPNGKIRLIASKPVFERIDVGNVLCHHSVLSYIRYPTSHIPGVENKDYLFWKYVYEFFDNKCAITNTPISYYNMISKVNMFVVKNFSNNKVIKKINLNNKQSQK